MWNARLILPALSPKAVISKGVATEAGDVRVDTEEGEALVVEPEVGAWFS
jgi:hypothetical protein